MTIFANFYFHLNSSGCRGALQAMAPPTDPVKIIHKKDGSRIDFMFLASQTPLPQPGRYIHDCLKQDKYPTISIRLVLLITITNILIPLSQLNTVSAEWTSIKPGDILHETRVTHANRLFLYSEVEIGQVPTFPGRG